MGAPDLRGRATAAPQLAREIKGRTCPVFTPHLSSTIMALPGTVGCPKSQRGAFPSRLCSRRRSNSAASEKFNVENVSTIVLLTSALSQRISKALILQILHGCHPPVASCRDAPDGLNQCRVAARPSRRITRRRRPPPAGCRGVKRYLWCEARTRPRERAQGLF